MFTTRPEIAGTFGVVATTHWIASQVGMAVLERGGNAFDAAAAAAFTLQVAEPHLNGPGGDAPIIIHSAADRHAARHLRPGRRRRDAATLERFADARPRPDPRHRPAAGHGAGRVRRLVPDAARLGHLGAGRRAGLRDRLCAATASHACPRIAATIESVRPLFEAEWPAARPCSCPAATCPPAGSAVRAPGAGRDLGAHLREAVGGTREARIDAARNAWYRGFVAEAIGGFFAAAEVLDASGRRHRGLLTGARHGALGGPASRTRSASTTTATRC